MAGGRSDSKTLANNNSKASSTPHFDKYGWLHKHMRDTRVPHAGVTCRRDSLHMRVH